MWTIYATAILEIETLAFISSDQICGQQTRNNNKMHYSKLSPWFIYLFLLCVMVSWKDLVYFLLSLGNCIVDKIMSGLFSWLMCKVLTLRTQKKQPFGIPKWFFCVHTWMHSFIQASIWRKSGSLYYFFCFCNKGLWHLNIQITCLVT